MQQLHLLAFKLPKFFFFVVRVVCVVFCAFCLSPAVLCVSFVLCRHATSFGHFLFVVVVAWTFPFILHSHFGHFVFLFRVCVHFLTLTTAPFCLVRGCVCAVRQNFSPTPAAFSMFWHFALHFPSSDFDIFHLIL